MKFVDDDDDDDDYKEVVNFFEEKVQPQRKSATPMILPDPGKNPAGADGYGLGGHCK